MTANKTRHFSQVFSKFSHSAHQPFYKRAFYPCWWFFNRLSVSHPDCLSIYFPTDVTDLLCSSPLSSPLFPSFVFASESVRDFLRALIIPRHGGKWISRGVGNSKMKARTYCSTVPHHPMFICVLLSVLLLVFFFLKKHALSVVWTVSFFENLVSALATAWEKFHAKSRLQFSWMFVTSA